MSVKNGDGDGFCSRVASAYPVPPNEVGVLDYTLGIVQILAMPLIIYFVKKQAAIARKMGLQMASDRKAERAAENVLFPVYVKWLVVLAWANVASGVATLFIPLGVGKKVNYLAGFVFALTWGFNHFCLQGIAVLLSQRGVGKEASNRAVRWGLAFAAITSLLLWPVFTFEPSTITSALGITWEVVLTLFYAAIYLSPRTWFFRRPAARHFGMFGFYFRLSNFVSRILIFEGIDAGLCTYHVVNGLGFSLIKNIVVYRVLLEDSWWWQGDFDTPITSNGFSSNLRDPLLGIDIKLEVAHQMAAMVDKVDSFSIAEPSLDSGGGVRDPGAFPLEERLCVLNFAFLQLDKSKLLGAGGSSKVYRGLFKNGQVAVKMLFVLDITPELIQRTVQEAQTLSRFRRYANVVTCYGVAVLPPCIAVVLELCERGSLYDVLKVEKSDASLNWNTRVGFALGAARGVSILHSAGILHRDIKSMNFLVDGKNNVKVADLELGGKEDDAVEKKTAHLECLNWVPPEVLRGEAYLMASDIYALGLVFYECCTSQIPFSHVLNSLELRKMIIDGKRPQLPPQTPTVIANLIANMVQEDPTKRPLIGEIVGILATIYQVEDEVGAITQPCSDDALRNEPQIGEL